MSRTRSRFAVAGGLALAALAAHPAGAATPILTTLFSFDGTNGAYPDASLILGADGNLLGTTIAGGGSDACFEGCGTVFEIAKTATGYAGTPTILVGFKGPDGAGPKGSLIADAGGNLFGTTTYGGSAGAGTVFEIAKTAAGYAGTPTVLARFDGTNGAQPVAGLIIDTHGNLLGTTSAGGTHGYGTVFEIAKTATGYADIPTILVSFDGANGANPTAGLIFDTDGNLFGTSGEGGARGYGTVFEIAKTAAGYADNPTTLVSFDGSDGEDPSAGLMFNERGDLLGTTSGGGPYGVGTVFEIGKRKGGYAGSPFTVVSFDGTNGDDPYGGLTADARGNLFGTTLGGATFQGTVFEVAKTAGGYSATARTLARFSGIPAPSPIGLRADAKGDLFGPTYFGGASNHGSVFELTGSGFVPLAFAGTPGSAGCYGRSVLSLLRQDRNLDAAAAALGLDRAEALQTAVSEYCGTPAP